MYFTLSPFFYFLAHCDSIKNYVVVELNGNHPIHEDEFRVKKHIKDYIIKNSHGIDSDNIDKYVEYIFKQLIS